MNFHILKKYVKGSLEFNDLQVSISLYTAYIHSLVCA